MIPGNVGIITVLTILLFLLPILIVAKTQALQKSFSFQNLLRSINKSLPLQIGLGLILLLSGYLLDKLVYVNSNGNAFTDSVIGTAYTFNVIGLFMYLPSLALLNLINLLLKAISKSRRI
jgi:hypothetical protein